MTQDLNATIFFTDFHFPFNDSFYDALIEDKDYYDNNGITKSILLQFRKGEINVFLSWVATYTPLRHRWTSRVRALIAPPQTQTVLQGRNPVLKLTIVSHLKLERTFFVVGLSLFCEKYALAQIGSSVVTQL